MGARLLLAISKKCDSVVLGYACSLAVDGSMVDVQSQTEVTAKIMYTGLCECH